MSAGTTQTSPKTTPAARRALVRTPRASGRANLPLHPMAEAVARVAFAYARNQHGLRDRRPLGRFLARNAAFLLAGLRQPTIDAEADGLQMIVPTSDRTIARSIYSAGDWDPLLVATVFEALARAGRDVRGTTFLEIGANFGVYALPAVTRHGFASAIAYEPDPASFALLVENVRRNRLDGVVHPVNAALSDEPGQLRLSRSGSNAGDNRIVAEAALARRGANEVAVPARTFDDEVAAGRIAVGNLGLAWLDVQGHEARVLAGATSLVASDVPLVVEYATGMMEIAARRRLDEIIADGYDVLVDLGWSALTNRIRFQPASSIWELAPAGRQVETDLLLLRRR